MKKLTDLEEIELLKPEYQNDPLVDLFKELMDMQLGDQWDGFSSRDLRIRKATASSVFIERLKKLEEPQDNSRANGEAIALLKEYEQWEADIINEDKLWWPNRDKDFFSGPIYDKMLELQDKRNEILRSQENPLPEGPKQI